MKTINHKILITIFLLFLILPHILWPGVKDMPVFKSEDNTENRELKKFPELSGLPVSDIPGEIESWFDDNIPFRDSLIYLNSRISYDAFDSSTTEKVVTGKNGWLFLNKAEEGNTLDIYRGVGLYTDEELADIASKLVLMRDVCLEKGTRFAFFIAPDKARIYPEYLPDGYKEPETDRTKQLVEYLRENTELHIVWPYEDLLEEKEKNPDNLLYYPLDSHWNSVGGYIGTYALSEEMDLDLPDISEVEITDGDRAPTDLANLMHLGDYLKEGSGPDIKGFGEDKLNAKTFEPATVFEFENFDEDAQDGLFAVRDSYMDYMFLYLASQYKRSKMVHHKVFDIKNVYDGSWALSGEYRMFLLEMAERRIGEILDWETGTVGTK